MNLSDYLTKEQIESIKAIEQRTKAVNILLIKLIRDKETGQLRLWYNGKPESDGYRTKIESVFTSEGSLILAHPRGPQRERIPHDVIIDWTTS